MQLLSLKLRSCCKLKWKYHLMKKYTAIWLHSLMYICVISSKWLVNEIYTQCINNSKLLLAGIKLKGTLFILTHLHVMKPYLNLIGTNTDRVNEEPESPFQSWSHLAWWAGHLFDFPGSADTTEHRSEEAFWIVRTATWWQQYLSATQGFNIWQVW